MSTRGRRPWLAVLLAFVYPGLGHVYLREWGRALLWFGLFLGSMLLLVPEPSADASGLDSLLAFGRDLPVEAVLALAAVTGFSMLDAYWLAAGRTGESEGEDGTRSCPSCGRELDESLDFCHWCTERLDAGPTEES